MFLILHTGDADSLDRTAGAIRGRASRVANVVTAEMSNYEPGIYTERVLEAVKVLRDTGKTIPHDPCIGLMFIVLTLKCILSITTYGSKFLK